jgi:hypothetical protein
MTLRKLDHRPRPSRSDRVEADADQACQSVSINSAEVDLFKAEIRELLSDPAFAELCPNQVKYVASFVDRPMYKVWPNMASTLSKAKKMLAIRKKMTPEERKASLDEWKRTRPAEMPVFKRHAVRQFDMGPAVVRPPERKSDQ